MNTDYSLLQTIVGSDKALEIAKAFQGSSIYFSKKIVKREIYKQIQTEYQAGKGYRELAQKHGYTESHIRVICNGAAFAKEKEDPKEMRKNITGIISRYFSQFSDRTPEIF